MILRVKSTLNNNKGKNQDADENQEIIINRVRATCNDINNIPFQFFTIELINEIWNILYPNCPSNVKERKKL